MKTEKIVKLMVLMGVAAVMAGGCKRTTSGKAAGTAAEEMLWLTDFEQAKQVAAEKNLPILADFSGSDWCGWCMKLDSEVFSTAEFKQYAEANLVLLLVDFPARKEQTDDLKNRNRALAEKYAVEGFPIVLLLDAQGKVVAKTGYQEGGAGKYIEHLKELLHKGQG